MRILGICHDVLICSACVVVDGEVVAAIPEERLDRQKQSRVFPTLAVQECLAIAGIDFGDLDEIAIGWNPGREAETTPPGFLAARRWRSEHFSQVPARLLALAGREASSVPAISELWPGGPRVTFVDHYFAHSGNGVFLSPFDSCAVLVLDGRGERHTGMFAHAQGAKLEVLAENVFPHSLGLLYGAVTQYLGFQPDRDEWKVMALAAYADPENEFLAHMRRLVTDGTGMFGLDLGFFEFFNFWDRRMFSDRFEEVFGPRRASGDPIEPRHDAIAAALQQVFEETVTRLLVDLQERTGEDSVVVAGGSFMNSVFNGKIERVTPFSRVHIGGTPDDSGTSVGAALYVHALRTGDRPPHGPPHNFWGREWSDEECQRLAASFRLPHEVVPDPAASAVADLVEGKLVGWLQGRAEFGQRALGNRSILADPRRPDARDVVNAAVKFREPFRPFAPAVLAEAVEDWFDCPSGARSSFMERVYAFRPGRVERVPAVAHVDGTGRVQTVEAGSESPRFRRLLERFAAVTGVPMVLNTSFNRNGEPIVDSPGDAIRTFYSSGLDVLYLGDVRISKARTTDSG